MSKNLILSSRLLKEATVVELEEATKNWHAVKNISLEDLKLTMCDNGNTISINEGFL